jgi:hypothetical protein
MKQFFQIVATVMCFCCLFYLAALGAPHRPRVSNFSSAAFPTPSTTQFVIADLDGDQIPDLALLEWGSLLSHQSSYSLRLQLRDSVKTVKGVVAPFGAVHVDARDVNGDDFLDIVLTSSADHTYLQVFLNDGHGNFSLAKAEDYAQSSPDSSFSRHAPESHPVDSFSLVSSRSFAFNVDLSAAPDHSLHSCQYLLHGRQPSASGPQQNSRQGRDPPAPVFSS